MKINKNVLKYTITGALPFASFALIILIKIAKPGIKSIDDGFILDAVLNTAAMLSFFIPFLKIFEEKFKQSDRIQGIMMQYKNSVEHIYNGNYTNFKTWCQTIEIENRRNAYLNLQLMRVGIGREEFESSYYMQPESIKTADELSKIQKKRLAQINKDLDRFECVDPDKVLPGIERTTVYKRLKNLLSRSEHFEIAKKTILSICCMAGLACLVFSVNFDARAVELATEIALKVVVGFWHIFMAYLTAHKLINRTYFNELSEKKLLIDEFKEYQNKTM